MKPYAILAAGFLAFTQISIAANVNLAWDAVTATELAGYQVAYGTASGQYSTILDVGNVTTSPVSIVAPGTYYFAVRAYGTRGELSSYSNEVSATIAGQSDTTPPVISAVGSSSVTATSAIIAWTTNEASDTQIEYGPALSYGSSTTINTSMVTSHSQGLGGLTAGTRYHYRVKSKDAAGNLAVSGDFTFTTLVPPDTTPPVISSVGSSSVTATSAIIAWTTDEASDTQIEYGTTMSYGSSTAINTFMVTSHSQSLGGLAAGTTYHYRVKSRDAAGNLAVSGDFTFTTLVPPDTTPPVISAVGSSSVTATSAIIAWTTDEASDTQIEYGPTLSYGSSTTIDTSMVTSHAQGLGGLAAKTTYYYRVKSRDAAGSLAVSANYVFATTAAVDITTGLVAAYSFDEGTGSVSADFAGNGNDAVIHSGNWTTGKYGNALSFDGSSSYVSAGIAELPALDQPKTISCWIYLPISPGSVQSMLSLANSALSASVQFGYKDTLTGVLDFGDNWMLVANLASLNQWHHVGYVFDGSQNRLYVDGVLAGTSTIRPAAAPVTSFEIGRGVTESQYFNGSIDDVRIYSRALSLDELKEAMNTPVGSSTIKTFTAFPPENTLLNTGFLALRTETAAQMASVPVVDVELEKSNYSQGEIVSFSSFRVSNSSTQSREAEIKAWLELPRMLPISLDWIADDLSLAAGSDHDYGATPLLWTSMDSPSGTGEANARLIDPVTGAVLSEDLNPFTIGVLTKSRSTAPTLMLSPHVELQRSEAGSRPQYLISIIGSDTVPVELKIWLESMDGAAISLISVGADGYLVLDADSHLTLDPLASVQLPDGDYILRARLLNAASGQILSEISSN